MAEDMKSQSESNIKDKSQQKDDQKDKNKSKFQFDELQMYYGLDYKINEQIIIKQPTIGQIIEVGEKKLYSSIMPFVSNPTSYRLQLWDMGVDWNTISDFDLFAMLMQGVSTEISQLIFGGIDFQDFNQYNKTLESGDVIKVLYSPNQNIEIDEDTYIHIAEYLRMLFNIHPKVETTKGRTMKEWLIEEEREKLRLQKDEDPKSTLLPMISTYLNHPGTKYKKQELYNVGIYEFMDSIKRLQIYESTIALMHGMYSGMIDMKGMDQNALNFMRDD